MRMGLGLAQLTFFTGPAFRGGRVPQAYKALSYKASFWEGEEWTKQRRDKWAGASSIAAWRGYAIYRLSLDLRFGLDRSWPFGCACGFAPPSWHEHSWQSWPGSRLLGPAH